MPMWSALYLLWGYHSPKNHITRREKPPYRDPINLRKLLGWNNVLFGEGNIEPVEDLPLWVLVWLLLVSCQTTVEPPFTVGQVMFQRTKQDLGNLSAKWLNTSHHLIVTSWTGYIYIYWCPKKLPQENEYFPPTGGTSPVSPGSSHNLLGPASPSVHPPIRLEEKYQGCEGDHEEKLRSGEEATRRGVWHGWKKGI